jgi:hypothetical protein
MVSGGGGGGGSGGNHPGSSGAGKSWTASHRPQQQQQQQQHQDHSQDDHLHLRAKFRLMLYVPTEHVGRVLNKSGALAPLHRDVRVTKAPAAYQIPPLREAAENTAGHSVSAA